MKTRMLPAWISGLVLTVLIVPVTGGFAQNDPNRSPYTSINTTNITRAAAPAKGNRATAKPQLSPWSTEIAKLAQAGVEADSILAYVDNAAGTFNLDADQIIYLKSLGVPGEVVTAMLQHDSELAQGLRPLVASTVPGSPPTVRITFTGNNHTDNAGKTRGATPILAAVSSAATVKTVDRTQAGSAVDEDQSILAPEPPDSDYSFLDQLDTSDAWGPVQSSADSSQELYPVRKPYPVELTGPIIVIQGWSRTPNTLLIEFSP